MVDLRKKIQRCDSRISSTISWQHAGNYFSANRLIIKSQERKFCYGLFEMWVVQSVLFWCHFCSRVLSNSLTFDLYNCSGWPSTPSSTKLHFAMWLEKRIFRQTVYKFIQAMLTLIWKAMEQMWLNNSWSHQKIP